MLTFAVTGKIKAGRAAEFYEKIASVAQRVTHEHDQAVVYQWFKDTEDEHLFYVHEQWPGQEQLAAHFETLYATFGPAQSPGGLPETIMGYLEHIQLKSYTAITA